MDPVTEMVETCRIAYIGSAAVERCGVRAFPALIESVRRAYLAHANRDVVLPKSEYLRYAHRPSYDRIIPLLGHLGGEFNVSGLKQICSSTGNGAMGFPRASGLIILNDPTTNRPFAVLEGALISAARTAAVSGLAIREFAGASMQRVAIIGCGQLGRTHLDMLTDAFGRDRFAVVLYDVDSRALGAAEARAQSLGLSVETALDARSAVAAADIIITATTSEEAYVQSTWLRPTHFYCAVSLLDAGSDVFRDASHIVVDDLNQCLHEGRPLDVLRRRGELPVHKISEIGSLLATTTRKFGHGYLVFNPMGTIITDLAVAKMIFDHAIASQDCVYLDV